MSEEEFFKNIDSWIQANVSEWNHVTLLAFFCYKYKERNGMEFRFLKNRKGPTLGKEAADFARLFKQFAPVDYQDRHPNEKAKIRAEVNLKIKNYISWIFDYKYRYEGKGKAVTTQFFLAPYSINEFELMYNQAIKKQKSKARIEDLVSWCQKEIPEIFSLHQLETQDDLKLIRHYAEMYKLADDSNERKLIKHAVTIGLINE